MVLILLSHPDFATLASPHSPSTAAQSSPANLGLAIPSNFSAVLSPVFTGDGESPIVSTPATPANNIFSPAKDNSYMMCTLKLDTSPTSAPVEESAPAFSHPWMSQPSLQAKRAARKVSISSFLSRHRLNSAITPLSPLSQPPMTSTADSFNTVLHSAEPFRSAGCVKDDSYEVESVENFGMVPLEETDLRKWSTAPTSFPSISTQSGSSQSTSFSSVFSSPIYPSLSTQSIPLGHHEEVSPLSSAPGDRYTVPESPLVMDVPIAIDALLLESDSMEGPPRDFAAMGLPPAKDSLAEPRRLRGSFDKSPRGGNWKQSIVGRFLVALESVRE